MLIQAALSCQRNRGVNVWTGVLEELFLKSQAASQVLKTGYSPQ